MDLKDFMSKPERARSRQVTYGDAWTKVEPFPRYRVSWIERTGELFAVVMPDKDVEIIGIFKTRKEVDRFMGNWKIDMDRPDSLGILTRRAALLSSLDQLKF
jgi:hypothetical protein